MCVAGLAEESRNIPIDADAVFRWSFISAGALAGPDPPAGLLVDAGGDLIAIGRAPDGEPAWSVGIEDPLAPGTHVAILSAPAGGVCTSAPTVTRWSRADGTPAHHLIDPRSGEPADTGLLSVTVAWPDPAWAEVWSKSLYLIGWRIIDLRRAENPYYLRKTEVAALDYLETQVQSDDVVLASLDIGQFVPALTGARSFLGHWAQTLDFYGKEDRVLAFFNSATSDADREAILRQYKVSYVVYSPEEAELGDYDPADASFLTEVYSEGDTTVYKVDPALTAR